MPQFNQKDCDSGFYCGHAGRDRRQTCRSVYISGSFPAVQCKSGSSDDFTYQKVPATVTAVTSKSVTMTHTITAYTINAPMIQINHMATDLPTSTQSSTASPSPSDSTSGINISASISGHLSPGEKAGIIVAACLAAIALFGLIVWLLFRCGVWGSKTASAKSEPDSGQVPPVRVTNNAMSQEQPVNTPKSELPGHHVISELDGSQVSGQGDTVRLG
ncbi:hypothetical protein BDV26DRAFT_260420 [Aspergillus bertholletiae]|uniref:Uncharacterized protein n=1 Tax=Aspergillus bertholletiae TaxID=1226010 RepID=A0A5N7BB68_9EURO|nr:hypothetical protein BDV26DRAFT_260420 [Aspergillus bertholletiae]